MTWKAEFPEFESMPELPEYMVDSSWHNDACPSFEFMRSDCVTTEYQTAKLWIEFEDPDLRETCGKRFQITYEGLQTRLAFQTDNLECALNYIESVRYLSARYRELVGYCPFMDSASQSETVKQLIEELESEDNHNTIAN